MRIHRDPAVRQKPYQVRSEVEGAHWAKHNYANLLIPSKQFCVHPATRKCATWALPRLAAWSII
jgi:hypothetical protein